MCLSVYLWVFVCLNNGGLCVVWLCIMDVCLYVYMCICLCTCYDSISVCMNEYVYIHMCLSLCICLYVCVCAYMCVWMDVCLCVVTCVFLFGMSIVTLVAIGLHILVHGIQLSCSLPGHRALHSHFLSLNQIICSLPAYNGNNSHLLHDCHETP